MIVQCIAEPRDFYQLSIVNVSDLSVVVGDINVTFIIINDVDGKIWTKVCNIRIVSCYFDCKRVYEMDILSFSLELYL